MSTVDVVVPCYNYGRFVRTCVESVLRQEGVDVRVLVIDDTSSDDTPQVGAQLAAEDRRVEFRRHVTNRGHIATYNEGLLGWARSDYSLLLSADDALAPGALARATRLMDANPDVSLAYGMALIIAHEDALPQHQQASEEFQILSSELFLRRCCESGNPVPTPTAVVRSGTQHKLGGYRADLPHTGDMEMWMRFATHGRVGVMKAVQGYYRWHNRNMSSARYADLLDDQQERLKACNEALGPNAARFPEAVSWLAAARSRMSEEAFWLGSKAFDAGDPEASRRCLEFASQIDPQIRGSSAWTRLRLKRALGGAVWRRLQPLVRRLRGGAAHAASDGTARFRPGQLNGWWPELALADR